MFTKSNLLTHNKIQTVLALLRAGQLNDARIILKQVCEHAPQQAEVWCLLGIAYGMSGNATEAEKCCRQAIAAQPDYVDAYRNLGVALEVQNRLEEAIAAYHEGLRLQPDHPEILFSLGNALKANGRLAEAIDSYIHALQATPRSAHIYTNLGLALAAQGRLEEAISSYHTALGLDQNDVNARLGLGVALYRQDKLDEAIACYRQAIAIQPNHADAHNNLGTALAEMNNHEEAVSCYRRAIAIQPNHADAYNNLGLALHELDRVDEAIASCKRALEINPNSVSTLTNIGFILTRRGLLEDGIAYYRKAIAIQPTYADAHNNLGAALVDLGHMGEAIEWYRRALAIHPDDADIHFHLSLALLRIGDFEHGWEEYEWRWRRKKKQKLFRSYPQPMWDGSDLNGRTILLWAEQGLGDTLQFIRYAASVKKRGARVVVECQPSLVQLLETAEGVDQVIGGGSVLPPFDIHLPLLSLPERLGTLLDTIPAKVPYLRASTAFKPEISAILKNLGNKKRVGIVWAGNPAQWQNHFRSCPLSFFKKLAECPDVALIGLQKNIDGSANTPVTDYPIHHISPYLDDFSDTAAAITQLDLVITVCTSVAHLSGALGLPTWVLLHFAADWRWLLNRDDTPWYPTMRLFRQRSLWDWPEVLDRVANELRMLRPKSTPVTPI